MNILFRAFRSPVPFVPQQGLTGLLEKRVGAASHLSVAQVVSKVGEWDRATDSDLYLDDDTTSHINHGSDPGTSAITLTQNAGFAWALPRAATDALALSDFVHVSLDGYYPPGTGGGDPDLSKHSVIASEDTLPGQPVYISSSNTVALADASDPAKSTVIGLLLAGATTNSVCALLTEGNIIQTDWTAVTGTTNLTPGAIYYLAATPGQLTETPPTGDGDTVVRVGVAITEQKLDIEVNEVVIL